MVEEEYDRWVGELQAFTRQRDDLVAERGRLDVELGRLAEAIATGGQLPALLTALTTKQAQRDEVAARIEHAEGSEADVRAVLRDWHTRLFRLTLPAMGGLETVLRSGENGRLQLRLMIPTPIVVTPTYEANGRWTGWDYEGDAFLGRLAGHLTCHPHTERVRIS